MRNKCSRLTPATMKIPVKTRECYRVIDFWVSVLCKTFRLRRQKVAGTEHNDEVRFEMCCVPVYSI